MCKTSCKKCATFKKCDISKCHAECCTFVPLSEQFITKHQDKIQRQIYCINEIHSSKETGIYGQPITFIEPITNELIERHKKEGLPIPTHNEKFYIDKTKQKCPFLTDDCKCAVYDERPELCKIFGTTSESDNNFTCHYHLGKSYHFPPENSPEKKKIDAATLKYFVRDVYNNINLFREMFPGFKRKEFLQILKQHGLMK